jgi:hypothetical protein
VAPSSFPIETNFPFRTCAVAEALVFNLYPQKSPLKVIAFSFNPTGSFTSLRPVHFSCRIFRSVSGLRKVF